MLSFALTANFKEIKKMNITLKHTEEQVELVKAMASRNRDVAYEAQAALAEFMSPVLAEVVNQAPTLSNMFSSFSFNADSNPSLPLRSLL